MVRKVLIFIFVLLFFVQCSDYNYYKDFPKDLYTNYYDPYFRKELIINKELFNKINNDFLEEEIFYFFVADSEENLYIIFVSKNIDFFESISSIYPIYKENLSYFLTIPKYRELEKTIKNNYVSFKEYEVWFGFNAKEVCEFWFFEKIKENRVEDFGLKFRTWYNNTLYMDEIIKVSNIETILFLIK